MPTIYAGAVLALLAPGPEDAQHSHSFAAYQVFRHEDRAACSASLPTSTTQGREANVTYWAFDDGRSDEVYFGIRPSSDFADLLSGSKTLLLTIDGQIVFRGNVGFGLGGLVALPIDVMQEFISLSLSGSEAVLAFENSDDALPVDLTNLRDAVESLSACLEPVEIGA